MNIGRRLTVVLLVAILSTAAHAAPRSAPWTFVVSGDSRNCGDVVMPSIDAATHASHARFYWHLGDLRFIRDFDSSEDVNAALPRTSTPPARGVPFRIVW